MRTPLAFNLKALDPTHGGGLGGIGRGADTGLGYGGLGIGRSLTRTFCDSGVMPEKENNLPALLIREDTRVSDSHSVIMVLP